VAASGGYYVAAPAHAIVAQPTTMTGSIGVISAHVVVGELLAKVGVTTEVMKRGAHADALQPTRPVTDDERAIVQRHIDAMYESFVGLVARGRKRAVPEIERVAQGRVWSGADAAREGLVDVLGGFDAALARARSLAAPAVGEAKARAMEPAVVRGARHAPPPLDPPQRKAARAVTDAMMSLANRLGMGPWVWLAGTRERALAWSEEGAALGQGAWTDE
jgi:protease-4